MKVLVIGGGGVIGQKLARELAERGHLRGADVAHMTLADVVNPAPITAGFPVDLVRVDISDRASVDELIARRYDVIYLLAAIVSAHAEEDFDAGMNINLFGSYHVFEAVRALGTKPVIVFSSSVAVYGGEVPDPIEDHTLLNPQTSYGTQKAIGEMLLNDYSRKGYFDGRGFRLPTISVRPGKPNRAASSFMSSIIREPLNGEGAICPVGPDFMHPYLSPRKCVENLILGTEVAAEDLGQNRCMMMPGRAWSIQQLVDAMTNVAGPEPAKLIKWQEDAAIQAIVNGWRYDMNAQKALRLGLRADDSFEDNVRHYIEDDRP